MHSNDNIQDSTWKFRGGSLNFELQGFPEILNLPFIQEGPLFSGGDNNSCLPRHYTMESPKTKPLNSSINVLIKVYLDSQM